MLYDLRLALKYRYDHPVGGSRHQVRIAPRRADPGQAVFRSELAVSPDPAETADFSDFFGNEVTALAFQAPHDRLEVTLTARLEVKPPRAPASAGAVLAGLGDALAATHSLGPDSPHHFLAPGGYTAGDDALRQWAQQSMAPDRPVRDIADELSRRIGAEFRYDGAATDVTTRAGDAFAGRHGVCQDFSHVMIAGLRAHGIPAAYVSGCLRTEPPPGQARLHGADAMHAWVRVWTGPETGWIAFDPTNGIPAGEDHITIGIGRDYADVTPILGVLRTSGEQDAGQSVDVIPVSPAA